jgi:hypothetical protein
MGEGTVKKHLKVRARLLEGMERVSVTILEQTGKNNQFGDEEDNQYWDEDDEEYYDKDTDFYDCENGVSLISSGCPMWDGHNTFYVRGYVEKDDYRAMIMPLADWDRIKVAIEAYNRWGATQ